MKTTLRLFTLLAALSLPFAAPPARAADHGDGPVVSADQSADLADCYFFLDPTDNSKMVIIGTVRGFIVPSEAVNFGVFDPKVKFRFNFEKTGDAKPDRSIDVTFSKRTSTSTAQTATIRFNHPNAQFTAPATNPSLNTTAPAPVVTTLGNGVQFFAGEVDDPFFFDIPGFNRWVGSILAGARDDTQLNRGRDSFAGYNILAIALRIPVSLIGAGPGGVIGANVATERAVQIPVKDGEVVSAGPTRQLDRIAIPAINVALIPFARKNEYNGAEPKDDAHGKFANDIVATLTALGTNSTNIGILASVAVTNGDLLRLNVNTANTGPQGGTNAGAGFPNGRRLTDDVIDTILFFINNQVPLRDHVDTNDLLFQDAFPFLARAQQPRLPGTIDDNTRN